MTEKAVALRTGEGYAGKTSDDNDIVVNNNLAPGPLKVQPLKTNVNEFAKYHKALMQAAPPSYVPHYFKCEKDGKNPLRIDIGGELRGIKWTNENEKGIMCEYQPEYSSNISGRILDSRPYSNLRCKNGSMSCNM